MISELQSRGEDKKAELLIKRMNKMQRIHNDLQEEIKKLENPSRDLKEKNRKFGTDITDALSDRKGISFRRQKQAQLSYKQGSYTE